MDHNDNLIKAKEKTKSFLRSYPVVVAVAATAVVSAMSARSAVRKSMGNLKLEIWLAADPNHPDNREKISSNF